MKPLKPPPLYAVDKDTIFVFGSNEAGRHGRGAALFAYEKRGAQFGLGFGPSGRAFAIPTKDVTIRNTLPLDIINSYVIAFMAYAGLDTRRDYQVTAIGCGLAGLKHEQIAPMFSKAPPNCYFDTVWYGLLPDSAKFWGTF